MKSLFGLAHAYRLCLLSLLILLWTSTYSLKDCPHLYDQASWDDHSFKIKYCMLGVAEFQTNMKRHFQMVVVAQGSGVGMWTRMDGMGDSSWRTVCIAWIIY